MSRHLPIFAAALFSFTSLACDTPPPVVALDAGMDATSDGNQGDVTNDRGLDSIGSDAIAPDAAGDTQLDAPTDVMSEPRSQIESALVNYEQQLAAYYDFYCTCYLAPNPYPNPASCEAVFALNAAEMTCALANLPTPGSPAESSLRATLDCLGQTYRTANGCGQATGCTEANRNGMCLNPSSCNSSNLTSFLDGLAPACLVGAGTGGSCASNLPIVTSVGANVFQMSSVGQGNSQTLSCLGPGAFGAASDVAFRFRPSSAGRYQFSTVGSDFDTVLEVRTSCAGTVIACDDNTVGSLSRVSVDLTTGQEVFVFVDGSRPTEAGQVAVSIFAE